MKKHKNVVIIVVLLVVAVVLLGWGAMFGSGGMWKDTDVACLGGGHSGFAAHIHAQLSMTVDGEPVQIPANTGNTGACMAELHTHGADNVIHIEPVELERLNTLTLSDFFDVWGEELERDDFELTARVNGEEIVDPAGLTFEDRQEIELEYTSAGSDGDDEENGETALGESCESEGGTWLAGHSECEIADEAWCSANGGTYNECASACRNDEDAEVCTQECVSVCSFEVAEVDGESDA